MIWKQKENAHLECNTIVWSCECLNFFQELFNSKSNSYILDVFQMHVKNACKGLTQSGFSFWKQTELRHLQPYLWKGIASWGEVFETYCNSILWE